MKNFTVLSKLGEGSFSTVFKVLRLSDNQIYALKKVKMAGLSVKEKQQALNEVRILASIENENIISYKEAFIDDQTLHIVMEYCDGGDLLEKIKKQALPELQICSFFTQLVKGLSLLHDTQIVHRDIKSANLFLTKDGKLKLGDLNVSKVNKFGMLLTQTGTPYYCSPEVWQSKPYDYKSDIWSAGCVLFEMCAQAPPFQANSMDQLMRKCCSGVVPLVKQSEFNRLIRMCLQQQPQLRPSCVDLLKILQVEALSEPKELIDTIQVPFNLGRINMPTAKYQRNLVRHGSLPSLPSLDKPSSQRFNLAREVNVAKVPVHREYSARPDVRGEQPTQRKPPIAPRNLLPPIPPSRQVIPQTPPKLVPQSELIKRRPSNLQEPPAESRRYQHSPSSNNYVAEQNNLRKYRRALSHQDQYQPEDLRYRSPSIDNCPLRLKRKFL